MHRLFVTYKPSGIGSNAWLGRLKRRYGVKKAGFSGTLDPFAKGVLIVAFGKYTSLFRFLDKTPKRYRATLWLGAHSETLDLEGVTQIDDIAPVSADVLHAAVMSLEGELTYAPPAYCAKHVNGKRAYDLARRGETVTLPPITSTIHAITLLHYRHPFVTFEATVSEGTYIRSLGTLICARLGITHGALSALERLQEGQFTYENEQPLDIRRCLALPQTRYHGDPRAVILGQKLQRSDFDTETSGVCWIDLGESLTVFELESEAVRYVLNGVPLNAAR